MSISALGRTWCSLSHLHRWKNPGTGKEASTRRTGQRHSSERGPGSCLLLGCSGVGTATQQACKWSPAACFCLSVEKCGSPEVTGAILRVCLAASPALLERTRALPKACTLPLKTASVRALFLACTWSVLFGGSPAGWREQTSRLGFLGVHVLSRQGRMCRGQEAPTAPRAACSPDGLLRDWRRSR